jgi:hypothetical protein
MAFNNIGLIATAVTFFGGLLLFYSDSGDFFYSLIAAILSAALVWVSIVMIGWLTQVFTK